MAGFSNKAEWDAKIELFVRSVNKDASYAGVKAGQGRMVRELRAVVPPENVIGLFKSRGSGGGTGILSKAIDAKEPGDTRKGVKGEVGLVEHKSSRAGKAAYTHEFGAVIVPRYRKALMFKVGGKKVFAKKVVIKGKYWFRNGWVRGEAPTIKAIEKAFRSFLLANRTAE